MVSFVVEKDGTLSSIKILDRDAAYFCFEQSVQAFMIKTNEHWKPAKKKGFAVRSKMVLPLYFEI